MIQRLEVEIDAAEAQLPPLRNFILPGGCESAGRLHLARTICRRGERLLVELNQHQVLAAPILPYFNRLGDWLFVMARLANRLAGVEEGVWKTNNPAAPAPAT
jgi:cob(I)alamin adenosyltransferase